MSIEEEAGWAPALFWAVWRSFFTLPGLEPRIVYLLRYPVPMFALFRHFIIPVFRLTTYVTVRCHFLANLSRCAWFCRVPSVGEVHGVARPPSFPLLNNRLLALNENGLACDVDRPAGCECAR